MKPLIAIMSCHSHAPQREAIRASWLRNVECDYKFFLGRGAGTPPADEVWLDCDDGYDALPHKAVGFFKYSAEHGYSNTFKCDDDTYVFPDRLVRSGYQNRQYIGFSVQLKINPEWRRLWFMPPEANVEFAAGDSGYWVDRELAEQIVDSPIWKRLFFEDSRTGLVARNAGIQLANDHRYIPLRGVIEYGVQDTIPGIENIISIAEFRPDEMVQYHMAPNLDAIRK